MAGWWRASAVVASVAAGAAVAVAAAAPALAQSGGFSDVVEDAYYSVPVAALAERGVFAGTECAQGFCPGDPIDRKTMAVWMVRVLDGAEPPALSESRFDDVDASSFHAPFIERLAELAVTKGCGDGSGFCPDRVLSRAQMAVFLTRAFGLLAGADPGFVDVPEDAWYAAAVSSLAASGITRGCGDGTGFCPEKDTSRAHMATFIHRAENRVGQPSDGPPARLGLSRFYRKYVDADGVAVVSSAAVPDAALYRARDIVTEMLSDRPSLGAALARHRVRVAIMARSSVGSDLPEFDDDPYLDDERSKGGGFYNFSVAVVAEENLLCYKDDIFPRSSVLVHEFAHAVHLDAAGGGFDSRLKTAFSRARAAGLWEDTYAATINEEYWAVGVQAWFDLGDPHPLVSNGVDTRAELEAYDPALADLMQEMFGEAVVSSSCHPDATSRIHETGRIQGVVRGPDRTPLEGIGLWVWSGDANTSTYTVTQPDGAFNVRVVDGSFSLNVYADSDANGGCTFVGWHGPGGLTTSEETATRIEVNGTDVTGIEIILPAEPHELPFVAWCA